ncbi:MAG: hypothetical protein HYY87_02065 [Candidatus Levybacteria bacterium]|nr:hypothetical protein [Candidatus Levybacteria bacterium]MBI2195988.1 hypothetical protein [Candidatus Daviesbacteria bacterium]MBI2622476.1 hypothetical protein [Candidatus Levybacteria bacterium]MBI3070067.1 hypothetical protein [Candidatus Levybacteria bacterium]MBI3092620.1 hypothetical protein [Candidatus Levybacteria bacterium]
MASLKAQAIQTTLTGNWQNAVTLNQKLLKEDPYDIEALNRLAFAFTILGKTKNAKTVYQKVLRIDSKNPIALKNLKRIDGIVKNPKAFAYNLKDISTLFIEEGGKTKVIELINLADSKVIALLRIGESLTLNTKRLKIFVLDQKKRYVGMLPDDIARRLIRFLKGGNIYEAYLKSIDDRKVSIFIKETRRSARFKNQPSFMPLGKGKISFAVEEPQDSSLPAGGSEES